MSKANKLKLSMEISQVDDYLHDFQVQIADYISVYIRENDLSDRQVSKIVGLSKTTIRYHLDTNSRNLNQLLFIATKLGLVGKLDISLARPKKSEMKFDHIEGKGGL
jgi:hypothetical protein